jgi:hypothetical protein
MHPYVLAHGALGPFDEIIFLGVGVIFLVMIGISWLKSRNLPPQFDESQAPVETSPSEQTAPDRFKLD